jgi:hypothetical protein
VAAVVVVHRLTLKRMDLVLREIAYALQCVKALTQQLQWPFHHPVPLARAGAGH